MPERSSVIIRPAVNVTGSLSLPGDKSISHRYAMLAAIAQGTTHLDNFSTGADCASTLNCLRALGCEWVQNREDSIEIHGRGSRLEAPRTSLDCGNSGSTMRMLSGILAGQEFTSTLVGDESLSRRPMARMIKPLTTMGARISSADGDRPPLRITGGYLKAINYRLPVASAQVKSALLFAGFLAEGETCIEEPVHTRDHGELALCAFGAEVQRKGSTIRLAGKQKLQAIVARIPGDISSAAFFLCAAALFPESQLVISDVLMNPTRTRLLDLLRQMGVKIGLQQLEKQHGELRGTLRVEGSRCDGIAIAGADSAALIDELPVLAAIAPYTTGGIEIRDAQELRVKESDRISAVAKNLRAMGAQVEEFEDGLRVPGQQKLHGADIDSCADHRIAMAFAVAGLRAQGETRIHGAESANISYPGFFDTLESLIQR
jgi:3-phosphoshikimate 1-carboxyvinyltransferase